MGKLSRLRRLGRSEPRTDIPKGFDSCQYCGDLLLLSDKAGQIEHFLKLHPDIFNRVERAAAQKALEILRKGTVII